MDNAVRENGRLRVTNNITEVCQYYAFFFGIATPETHKKLWEVLIDKFGPSRNIIHDFPDVYPANAFIGNYLRLELLSYNGYIGKMVNEITDFLSI